MQAAEPANGFGTRPQEQMVGICQQHVRTKLAQLGRRDAFDGARRADRAKERRLYGSMRRVQHASPCAAVTRRVGDLELNAQGRRSRFEKRRPISPSSEISQPAIPTRDHSPRLCRLICSPLMYTAAGEAATSSMA